jgi:electron transport complex protein RnfC
MLHILDIFKCVIAVSAVTASASKVLRTVLFDEPNIFLANLPGIYPAGFPHQLSRAITGSKKMPSSGGALIVTPSCAIAVNRAIKEGRPSISTTLSLGGKGLSALRNIQVRNGTLVSEITAFASKPNDDLSMPVSGGPFGGRILQSLETPVLPDTTAIMFLSKDEFCAKPAKQCVRCGACVRACPELLNPALLSVTSQYKHWMNFARHRPADCTECGCCAYVCPSNRPIVRQIREGKTNLQRDAK